MDVNNEKDLAWVLPEQTSKKLQEDISPKTLLNTIKFSSPLLVMAEMILQPKRFSAPEMTSV